MALNITMPEVPVAGLPTGVKEAGQRVDFKPDKFETAIETKGYLIAWVRASVCPCTPVATETQQPDPNCTLCKGQGWYYFGGNVTQDLDEIGDLDEVQKKIITDNSAMVIRGIVTGVRQDYSPYDKLGNWQQGMMNLTVRHENRLGYYDKIILLDSDIVYSEIVEATGDSTLPTRYLATGVNQIRTISQVYTADDDYKIEDGVVTWQSGSAPASGTRIAIHYLCPPTFLVIEHPHVIRTTSVKFKTATPKTSLGDPRKLPIQALMRYEFLPVE